MAPQVSPKKLLITVCGLKTIMVNDSGSCFCLFSSPFGGASEKTPAAHDTAVCGLPQETNKTVSDERHFHLINTRPWCRRYAPPANVCFPVTSCSVKPKTVPAGERNARRGLAGYAVYRRDHATASFRGTPKSATVSRDVGGHPTERSSNICCYCRRHHPRWCRSPRRDPVENVA